MSQLVEHAEKLVNLYNRNLAADLELLDASADESDGERPNYPYTIDLSNLLAKKQSAATDQVAYLVDMAKAEALDAMGETEQAVALVDRHV